MRELVRGWMQLRSVSGIAHVFLPAKNKVVPSSQWSVLIVDSNGRTHRDEEFRPRKERRERN